MFSNITLKLHLLFWLLVFSPSSLQAQVSDGQAVNASVTNGAFLSKNSDTTALGKVNVNNSSDPTVSGSEIFNIQREFNSLSSFTGKAINQVYNYTPVWTNSDVGSTSDNVKVRADDLTAKFNSTTGHTHTGAFGDAPQINIATGIFGVLPEPNGGTNQSTYATGDTLYSSASNTLSKLSGNTTTTKKFLSQTGTGSASQAPAWGQPAFSDITGSASLTTQVSGTLPVGNGGTNATSYTDGQLLIGNTTGNTLVPATLTQGANITITNGHGSITIAASSSASPQFNYTAQTSNYNAVVSDFIVASGASFSITLPTAVSQSGKGIKILHNGTSLTQIYTLITTSGQTIGGVASGAYVLYTNGESLSLLSDGSNWQIDSHKATTPWSTNTAITLSSLNAYVFTIPSSSITAGTIYTNNGCTFTVTSTTVSSTSLATSGTCAPAAATSTLVYVSGTVGNLTYTARTTTGQPVFGTGTNNIIWRRVGNNAEVYYEYNQTVAGTGGSGNYILYMPSGIIIDTSQMVLQTILSAQNATAKVAQNIGYGEMVYGNVTLLSHIVMVPYSNNAVRNMGCDPTNCNTWDGSSNYGFGTAAVSGSGRMFFPVVGSDGNKWQP